MSKACKETRVQLCKEIDFGDGEVSTIRAMVTEEQAQVVFKLEEAADYLKKVAEYLEGQKDKVICKKGKKAFGMLADDNYKVATELIAAADRFVFMCNVNGEIAEHIQMGR